MTTRPTNGGAYGECCECWMVSVCLPCVVGKWITVTTQRSLSKARWERARKSGSERLCYHCSEILRFREAFDSGSTYFTQSARNSDSPEFEDWLYDPPKPFGPYSAIKNRGQECACCEVIGKGLDAFLPLQGLQADGKTSKHWRKDIEVRPTNYGCSVQAQVSLKSSKYFYDEIYWYRFRIFFHVQDKLEKPLPSTVERLVHQEYTARHVKPKIDLTFARNAYRHCHKNHATCQSRGYEELLSNPQHMRLIDVESLQLVMAPAKCEYVALSYVWGGVNSTQLPNPNSPVIDLQDYIARFPQTIQDSVIVVRAMGIRYLWIDDICILGTATNSKVSQFGDMHRIYGNAQFCIIAAQGNNAEEGLYGIQPDSRPAFEGQFSGAIDNDLSLVRELPLTAPISNSPWTTRGWCLQEQLLSKAFLVFWDNQVYWQCPKLMEFEDFPHKAKTIPDPFAYMEERVISTAPTTKRLAACRVTQLPLISQILNPDAPAGLMDRNTVIRANGSTLVVRPTVFDEYTAVVTRYSQRTLTHPGDALRAIDGVLAVFEHGFQSKMLYGIPESFLDAALLWRASTPLTRRCEDFIPSWSWAGWQGEVGYQDTITIRDACYLRKSRSMRDSSKVEHFERLRPWVQWYTTAITDQKNSEIQPRLVNGNGWGIRSENNLHPGDWASKKRVRSFPSEKEKAWFPSPHSPFILQFFTLRTTGFKLGAYVRLSIETARHKEARYRMYEDKQQKEIVEDRTSLVLDVHDVAAGHLTRDTTQTNQRIEGEAAMIVLSEAQLFDDLQLNQEYDLLNVREDEFRLFNVMLIDIDTKTMIAQRLGIGKVSQVAFHDWDGSEWGPVNLR